MKENKKNYQKPTMLVVPLKYKRMICTSPWEEPQGGGGE